jgi:hypothetical protein
MTNSLEDLVWSDCVRMAPEAEVVTDPDGRRATVERCARRIGVHTVGTTKPKMALVRVDYTNGEQRMFRFARGNGATL